ncbi:MAG: ParB-like nuclease domain-containing protein [Streptosporangiaceae bacterium]|nr:ParB-like nuclease domain-containing protein [Streptosporangiaceae bacterium]
MSDRPTSESFTATLADTNDLSQFLAEVHANDLKRTTWVPVDSLTAADTPRLEGLDPGHAAALAEIEGELPPILVQHSTMQVIDGLHRLDAARIRGDAQVQVFFLDCNDDQAFLLAVAANIRHGLPLTLRDRRAAAARIIKLRPDASDRWIGELAGLSWKTVAAVRRDEPGMAAGPTHRIGRDGRVRPLNAAEGRRLAGRLFADNPDASLRQIARNAGISVGTARDVREKLRQGIDPVLPKREASPSRGNSEPHEVVRRHGLVDYEQVLQRLRRDPSLRYTDSGKTLLRWLRPPRLVSSTDWKSVIDSIPPHRISDMMQIAYSCAAAWDEFGQELDRRNREVG